ncbi:DUF3943 domain-containing protein [Photobacterium atrarenae]|uniref:DUF3943 domain-containing protein n=1 Tax=Photobacterium atrarenae TaxID=865757 RepID=A0ABY5GIM5_9GAMM|nr:DUF3943 domain-containing protein [Photobacterium atrarenae]UTV28661.1 DUF3943 domain-containing protein [Photobacterium atrarenae]
MLSALLSFSAFATGRAPAPTFHAHDLFLYQIIPDQYHNVSLERGPAADPKPSPDDLVPDQKNWPYLKAQSYTILGLSVATAGLMTLLPDSVTHWEGADLSLNHLGRQWWDNVSAGPTWDQDDHILNYVMHPYFGGVYYTTARHAGYDEWDSFLYSAALSTFYWEYGIEALAEQPSIQDLIVTPIFGAAVGEWMLLTEAEILANDGQVMHSRFLGDVSLFLLNPVGHIHHWVNRWWDHGVHVRLSTTLWSPESVFAPGQPRQLHPNTGPFIGLSLSLDY